MTAISRSTLRMSLMAVKKLIRQSYAARHGSAGRGFIKQQLASEIEAARELQAALGSTMPSNKLKLRRKRIQKQLLRAA